MQLLRVTNGAVPRVAQERRAEPDQETERTTESKAERDVRRDRDRRWNGLPDHLRPDLGQLRGGLSGCGGDRLTTGRTRCRTRSGCRCRRGSKWLLELGDQPDEL